MNKYLLFLAGVLAVVCGGLVQADFDSSGEGDVIFDGDSVSVLTSWGDVKIRLNGNVKACVMGKMTYFHLVKSFFAGREYKELKSPYCEEVLPELKAKLNDTNWRVRGYALVATALLFRKGIITEEDVLNITRAGIIDSDSDVRVYAVWLLSVLGPKGLPLLLETQMRYDCWPDAKFKMLKDCHPFVRQEVMRTLGFMGSWTLLEEGLNDKNYEVRQEALSALAHVPEFVAVSFLRKSFENYKSDRKRFRRRYGQRDLIAVTNMAFYFYREFQNKKALMLLYQIMNEVNVHPRSCSNKNIFCVIFQVQGFKQDEGVKLMEDVFYSSSSSCLHSSVLDQHCSTLSYLEVQQALNLLGRYMKGEQSFQLLMNLTHVSNVLVRLEAVRLLRFRQEKQSVLLLQKIAQDPEEDSAVKELALQSLHHLKGI